MRKKIHTNGHGSATYNEALSKPKKKPPVPYKEPQWLTNLRYEQDMVMLGLERISDETKAQIREKWGMV